MIETHPLYMWKDKKKVYGGSGGYQRETINASAY